jgi:hypothetical protein
MKTTTKIRNPGSRPIREGIGRGNFRHRPVGPKPAASAKPQGGATSNRLQFAVCISNSAYPDDLKVRTVYQILRDKSGVRSNYIRVIDETGEDYLYPAEYFVFVDLPAEAAKALMVAAS